VFVGVCVCVCVCGLCTCGLCRCGLCVGECEGVCGVSVVCVCRLGCVYVWCVCVSECDCAKTITTTHIPTRKFLRHARSISSTTYFGLQP